MSERKLTPEEIDRLFEFCRKHYVPEYDLQIELVDHLASGIEEQWRENPDIPFPIARINTFEKFGVYGFSKIKEQKEKELRRKYGRLFWQYTLEFYKFPKIVMTGALTILLFMLYQQVNSFFWVSSILFAVLMFFNLWYVMWFYPKKQKIRTIDEKPFLLINFLNNRQMAISATFQLPLIAIQVLDKYNYSYLNNLTIMFAASFLIVILGVFIYVYFLVLPAKVRAHFMMQFPQFAIT